MSAATLAPPKIAPPPSAVPRRGYRFPVDDYQRMVEIGLLGPEHRVELLDGEVVPKMAIGERHAAFVTALTDWSYANFLGRATIRVQNPVRLAESMPEPDLVLARLRADRYAARTPEPADCLLVIEVADTSAEDDLGRKATLYAAAGIVEYWVVDLLRGIVHVHLGPQPNGTWTSVEQVRTGRLAPQAFPDATLEVAELLA